MISLEDFTVSYNYKQEQRIFEQLDLIDENKKFYLKEKYKHREIYYEKYDQIKKQILEHNAHISIAARERRISINQQKKDYQLQLAELKENYKLDVKEIKQHKKLILGKMEANYKRYCEEFNKAIKLNDPSALTKKQQFEIEFVQYKEKVIADLMISEQTKLTNREEKYNNDLLMLKEQYDLAVNQIDEKFLGVTKVKEFIETNPNATKKEINDFKKGLNYSYIEKSKRKKEVLRLEKELKIIAKERKIKETANKENVLRKKQQYLKVRQEALSEIKKIKEEIKDYRSKLDKDSKNQYNAYQKLVRQDYASRRKKKLDEFEKEKLRRVNPAYIYIAPAVFGATFFTILPCIFMIITAFFKLDLTNLSNSKFVGFDNFINIFKYDIEFQKALTNTLLYALFTIVLLIVVVIAMAAWLAKNTKIHNAVQTMVFTPHIASLVAISILWIAMLNPTGLINQVLAWFGIEGPGWLIQENTSLISVSFVTVWKDIGYYVLIVISGLQGIPAYIYEAAKLDKSGKVNTFFKLTLPLLVPTLSFVFVTKFINSFKVFAPIEIMTNGGPMGSSMVLSYWIYKVGRVGYNYGQAMAGAIVLTIIIAICTFFNYRFFKKQVTY